MARRALLAGLVLLVTACGSATPSDPSAPPKAKASPLPEPPPSQISLPVRVPLQRIAAELEKAIPKTLWQVDKPNQTCVKAQKIKLFKAKIKVTPDFKCRIIGHVTRGRLRLSGNGDRLRLAMPVHADVEARHIGGIIKREATSADAQVWADLHLGLTKDGNLTSRIAIDYDWDKQPSIDILGVKINLAGKAEPKLREVIARAERDLPARLATLPVRGELEKIWQQGFTVQSINRDRPAAWLLLKPQQIGFGGIRAQGKDLVIDASLQAIAEIRLGDAPPRPVATALPPIARMAAGNLVLMTHVLADYQTLEPVLGKALNKLSAKGIAIPRYGRVAVTFGRPTLYATTNNRLALGVNVSAKGPRGLLATKGVVWLTAHVETAPGTELVLVKDIQLATGKTDDLQLPLLTAVAMAPQVKAALEAALAQNFSRDYGKLMVKVDRALQSVTIGPFKLSATLGDVQHGDVLPLGQGLFMPIAARGSARLDYGR